MMVFMPEIYPLTGEMIAALGAVLSNITKQAVVPILPAISVAVANTVFIPPCVSVMVAINSSPITIAD